MHSRTAIPILLTFPAALAAALLLAPAPSAHADPGQICTPPEWMTYWTVPIGSRSTCFKADGSYQGCSSLGAAGNGPGRGMSYPAAPVPLGQPTLSPPVPGAPPPPPPPG